MTADENNEIYNIDLNEVKSLSSIIADRLAELIQKGLLKPGEHLVQNGLAEQFGVSRVAVRDALQQLRQKGLAVNVPLKGTIVHPVTTKTIDDIFAVRRIVEGFAAREACIHMTSEDIILLEKIISEQEEFSYKPEMLKLSEKDWEFHKAIYSHCSNEILIEIISVLWSRMTQAKSLVQFDENWGKKWSKNSIIRHRSVIEAFKKRDPDKVNQLITETITLAEEELIQELEGIGWVK